MKSLRVISAACFVLAIALGLASAQTWTPLTNQPPRFRPGTALLLMDGRVLAQDNDQSDYWTLTPDNTGSYLNGTWTQVASLPSGYGPEYYASAVLPDGRVVVMGGEYNLGTTEWTTLGAIYNPETNVWNSVQAPSGWTTIGDAQSVVLPNGTFMLANCCTEDQALLNEQKLTWTPTGAGKEDENDEEGWTLLPNGEVLTVDTNSKRNMASEIYDPVVGAWYYAGSTVVELIKVAFGEIGPAVLRPDGTVLATGGNGNNAVYDTSTGTWSAAPPFPSNQQGQQLDIADGPAAILPDGNVLCMTSPNVYVNGAVFFEWDGANFNQTVDIPRAPLDSSYVGRMLVLPTGQILFTDGSTDVEVYTSTGVPNPSWAPTITKFAKTIVHGKNSILSGTQFNGLSQGAAYGDDAQMATNYPLVRITNNATGHVFYARSFKPSTMGVATGSKIVRTHFQVPSGIELGASQLEVVANGIASNPVSVTIK
jgi:hypothetical protein